MPSRSRHISVLIRSEFISPCSLWELFKSDVYPWAWDQRHDGGQLRTSLYDKRDDFNFHITHFSFPRSNIQSPPALDVLAHNLFNTPGLDPLTNVLFWERCDFPIRFLARDMSKNVLKSSLRKFYGRYGDLIKQYETTFLRTPSIDQTLHQLLTLLLIWTLLPNLTFYIIVRGFHSTFARDANRWRLLLRTTILVLLACVLMLRPVSPELVLFQNFWVLNIPW